MPCDDRPVEMWKGVLLQGCKNPGRKVAVAKNFFFSGVLHLWVLRMELRSCHRFQENLCTRAVLIYNVT